MKPQSEISNLKRALRTERELLIRRTDERETYRARATKAEQETAEWKRRFDALLMRTREEPKP